MENKQSLSNAELETLAVAVANKLKDQLYDERLMAVAIGKLKAELGRDHDDDHEKLAKLIPTLERMADAFKAVENSTWRIVYRVVLIALGGGFLIWVKDKIGEAIQFFKP